MTPDTRVLVVDDDADSRICIKHILEGAGLSVTLAPDGFAALEALKTESVDLILADIAMPEMNGYQLFQVTSQDPRWVGLPFVFLTARSFDSDVRYGKSLGVDDYLTKPFRAADLLSAVEGSLLRARRRREFAQIQPSATVPKGLLTVGRLEIDTNRFAVRMNDRAVQLSGREYRLLLHLAENQGCVVTMQDLVRVTHELDTDYTEASGLLRPIVRSVRRKLGFERGELGCIGNIRGVGYQLTAT